MTYIREYAIISDGKTIDNYYDTNKMGALRKLRQAYPYTFNAALIRYTGRCWDAGWFWSYRPDLNPVIRAAERIPNRITTRTGGR